MNISELEKLAREQASKEGQKGYEPIWEECPFCQELFILGFNGIDDGEETIGCDKCLGIERDKTFQANFWFPNDEVHTYSPLWAQYSFTMTREEAFGPNANEIFLKRGGLWV